MMAKKLLLLTLISLILGGVLWLGFEVPAIVSAATPAGAQLFCAQPSQDALPLCRAMEQRILAATVRIELVSWLVADNDAGYEIDSSIGHATVKDGRYLVTHNHFSIPLSIRPRSGEPEVYAVVKLSSSRGELLFEGPLSDFELVLEESGTLVIAHKDEGLLMRLGFTSALFADGSSATLAAGAYSGENDHVFRTMPITQTG